MTAVLEATALGKRYRHKWALRDCTLRVPEGHVVGIVGPNGSGKSTLLNLAAGLLVPSVGTLDVLGGPPARDTAALGRVGFVAQDPPVFASLSVGDHLRFGARLNPAGTRRSPTIASKTSDSIPGNEQESFREVSVPSSRSPWRSPSARISCCSMSPSPAWTRWPAASSYRS